MFQTDPCGVEARSICADKLLIKKFQTDPCGVEAIIRFSRSHRYSGFRRTLVGLKQLILVLVEIALHEFQTDPCGVEADSPVSTGRFSIMFQTDPCGVEAPGERLADDLDRVSDGPLWG